MVLVSSVNGGLPAGKVSLKDEVAGMHPCDWWGRGGGAVSCTFRPLPPAGRAREQFWS